MVSAAARALACLVALPAAPTNGLSLGLCGLAAVVKLATGWVGVARAVAWGGATLQIAFVARCAAAPGTVRAELRQPRALSGYATLQMAFTLLAAAAYRGGAVALGAGAAAQLVVFARFLERCAAGALAPEPFWAPAVVSAGVTAVAGADVLGATHPLVLSSFFFCGAAALVLAPALAASTADRAVAADCTIAIVQAPFSLPAAAYFAMRAARGGGGPVFSPLADAAFARGGFACSTVGVALTAYRLWQRRGALWRRGLDGTAAALTFPTCLSAVCALRFAKIAPGAAVYAYALAAVAAIVVVGAAAGLFSLGLAAALAAARPAKPDAESDAAAPDAAVAEVGLTTPATRV